MIFGELNGWPLQATISLTQSCFRTHRRPIPPFSFSSSASLSQRAADRERHDVRLLCSVLEPAAPHHFSFAFCFQVELVSALVNNQ